MNVYHEYSSYEEKLEAEYRDSMIKTKAVIEYCQGHLDQMWAAKVAGLLLGCDFRDAKDHLEEFFDYCESENIE